MATKYTFTDKMKAELIQCYHNTSSEKLAVRFNCPVRKIYNLAHDLGLKKSMELEKYKLENCTHNLKCVHAIGNKRKYYYMPCIPISTKNGKIKVVVFGDRYWIKHQDKKQVRYVDGNRIFLK